MLERLEGRIHHVVAEGHALSRMLTELQIHRVISRLEIEGKARRLRQKHPKTAKTRSPDMA